MNEADGSVAGVFIEGNDVTDHKRAEEALRKRIAEMTFTAAQVEHEPQYSPGSGGGW